MVMVNGECQILFIQHLPFTIHHLQKLFRDGLGRGFSAADDVAVARADD